MKKQGRRKRSERGTGRLFKKVGAKQVPADSPAAGVFYLTYMVEGKRKTESLRDEHGAAITDRTQAENERKRILAPFLTGDKAESLRAIQSRLQDADTNHAQAVDEADPPLQITEAWAAYKSNKVLRPESGLATLEQYEGHWNRFQNWINTTHPEAEYLRDVTDTIALEYANDLLKSGLSNERFNKHIRFLCLLHRVQAKSGKVTVNPWKNPKRNEGEGIPRRENKVHSRRELTVMELTTILSTASGDFGLLLLIGAATGLRLGDCATLKWGEVDLARGIIRRIPNKTSRKGKPVVIGIPPALHERLTAIPAKRRTGYVLPTMATRYHRDPTTITNEVREHIIECGIDVHAPGTGEQIKRKDDGTPEREDDGKGKVITVATGKAAVVDVGFHSLRHTWVSLHAMAGTPGAVIQASVGHSNPAMTAHYTHVNEVTARDVARSLPQFGGTEIHREPLPTWAVKLIESMTEKNLKTVKAELLKGGEA
jgi:integrase